jgi:hypothetical protein
VTVSPALAELAEQALLSLQEMAEDHGGTDGGDERDQHISDDESRGHAA